MKIPPRKTEFSWWKSQFLTGSMSLLPHRFTLEIFSDASPTGWGAACGGRTARGSWTHSECDLHINQKISPMLTFYFGLIILLLSPIPTAWWHSISSPNAIAFQIWQYCGKSKLFVFASYIRSAENSTADSESLNLDLETEYEISDMAFKRITSKLGQPNVDLFASRKNFKCDRYFSWKCDPGSEVLDAFTVPWDSLNFYAFPPFSLILRTLQKIQREKATGILVVPNWPGQPWFSSLQGLAYLCTCVSTTVTIFACFS